MPLLLLTMALDPAGPLDHPPGVLTPRRKSHGRGRPRPPPRSLFLPPRRFRPRPRSACGNSSLTASASSW